MKTAVRPEEFQKHLNTLDGLGYACETIVPNADHTAYTLIFRRDDIPVESLLASLKGEA